MLKKYKNCKNKNKNIVGLSIADGFVMTIKKKEKKKQNCSGSIRIIELFP